MEKSDFSGAAALLDAWDAPGAYAHKWRSMAVRDSGMVALCAMFNRDTGHQPRLPPHIVAAVEKTLGRVTWLHGARGSRGRSFVYFSHGVGGGDPASHRAFVTAKTERVGGTTYLLTCRQCPDLAAALVGDDTVAVMQ